MKAKDLKRQIRKLKKLKLQMRPGSKERIKTHRTIKELQEQLKTGNIVSPEKAKLIEQITKGREYHIDLKKFTVEQLTQHLDYITKGEKR